MSSFDVHTETELFTDPVLLDREGSLAHSARTGQLRTLQIVAGLLGVSLLGVSGAAMYAVSRPPKVVVIRVDAVKGAEAIRLNTSRFDVRAPEIRTRLLEWAFQRYRLLKSTADDDFKLNYYLLSPAVRARVEATDKLRVAAVVAGAKPEQTIDVNSTVISLPPLAIAKRGDRNIAMGRARLEIALRKSLDVPLDQDQTIEMWRVDLEYVVDPIDAAERADTDPKYQVWNPLGISITSFYETRLPDDPNKKGGN